MDPFITAPSIPETEKVLICKEFIDHTPESLPCGAVTICLHLQGTGVIQTHHADETLAVDLLGLVAHQNGKRLNRCQRDEFLHILKERREM